MGRDRDKGIRTRNPTNQAKEQAVSGKKRRSFNQGGERLSLKFKNQKKKRELRTSRPSRVQKAFPVWSLHPWVRVGQGTRKKHSSGSRGGRVRSVSFRGSLASKKGFVGRKRGGGSEKVLQEERVERLQKYREKTSAHAGGAAGGSKYIPKKSGLGKRGGRGWGGYERGE